MLLASQKHMQNVKRLERTLNFLSDESEQHRLDIEEQAELKSFDLKFMDFIKKWRRTCRDSVDYEMVRFKQLSDVPKQELALNFFLCNELKFMTMPQPGILSNVIKLATLGSV